MTRELIEWPFGRNSLGFDQMFQNLQHTAQMSTYPPYNIWQLNADGDTAEYRIEVALAGFSQDDITITHEKNTLSIVGEVTLVESATTVSLHKGISNKKFERLFTMAETMEIKSAKMKNGMLVIIAMEVIPESMQAKTIKIS